MRQDCLHFLSLKICYKRNCLKHVTFNRNTDGRIYYRETTNPDVLALATADVRLYLSIYKPGEAFTATSAFIATWHRETHFGAWSNGPVSINFTSNKWKNRFLKVQHPPRLALEKCSNRNSGNFHLRVEIGITAVQSNEFIC